MSWGFTVLLTKAGAAFLEENGAEILEGDGKYLIPSEYRYFSSYKLRDGRIVHARVPYGSAPFLSLRMKRLLGFRKLSKQKRISFLNRRKDM